jgi:hypothetical protein
MYGISLPFHKIKKNEKKTNNSLRRIREEEELDKHDSL